jgi:hypothetical protein
MDRLPRGACDENREAQWQPLSPELVQSVILCAFQLLGTQTALRILDIRTCLVSCCCLHISRRGTQSH